MVFRWRKVFCTSIPKEAEVEAEPKHDSGCVTPKFGARFGFFSSNPSTPKLQSETNSSPTLRCRTKTAAVSASVPVSPKLHCEISKNPKLFQWSSTPSSPSTFSLPKSNLRLSTNRCGLCLQNVESCRGVAIFTAECSHCFHSPCIAVHMKNKGKLACPICGTIWKQMPLLSVNDQIHNQNQNRFVEEMIENVVDKKNCKYRKQNSFPVNFKVYDDDEPSASLTPKARCNPIPESEETCDEDSIGDFQGLHTDSNTSEDVKLIDIDVRLLPEVAVVSSSRSYETYAVVLKVKPPPIPEKSQNRATVDLVAVVDVSGKISKEKLQMMKRAMKLIISSLSDSDRLSIVAFSSYSKRLLPLKRMTNAGQRAARRIVEAMAVLEGSSNPNDAAKKAVKVLEDRREKNSVDAVILLSDNSDKPSYVLSTRHSQSHPNVAIHTVNITAIESHAFANSVKSLLNVVVQDLQLQLDCTSGSTPAKIAAVYAYSPRPVALGSGVIRIEELRANEERKLLIELKVPSSATGAHQVLSVRCRYRESVTQELIHCKQYVLIVPSPHTVRSSSSNIQRLKNLFVTTRALAESRRLTSRNDFVGAHHMLISSRALLHQSSPGSSEFVVRLEAELNDLKRRRQTQSQGHSHGDDKGEPLTPTSAWRVAEKLAKVAIMRKSLNRVSDLHGFEDARF